MAVLLFSAKHLWTQRRDFPFRGIFIDAVKRNDFAESPNAQKRAWRRHWHFTAHNAVTAPTATLSAQDDAIVTVCIKRPAFHFRKMLLRAITRLVKYFQACIIKGRQKYPFPSRLSYFPL